MIDQKKVSFQAGLPSAILATATRVRYRVLGLSFLMAFLMYMERGAIGAAAPNIMREFRIDKITMGWSVSAFNWSYALFQVPGGWMADRFGARIVLAGAIAWWSAFTAGTGLSFNAISLAITRLLFGVGEAAAFPADRELWSAGYRPNSVPSVKGFNIPAHVWERRSHPRWSFL
jgi:MFS family permease